MLNLTLPWETDGQSALGPERIGQVKGFHRSDREGDEFLAGEVAQLDETRGYEIVIEHAVDRFLTATGDPLRWWKVGPNADLVGRSVDEIRTAGTTLTRTTSSLASSSKADDVDLSSGMAPSLVQASTPDLQEGDAVVVAVNGTVWSGTEVYDIDDGPSVAAIVPSDAFEDGENDVEVYAVN